MNTSASLLRAAVLATAVANWAVPAEARPAAADSWFDREGDTGSGAPDLVHLEMSADSARLNLRARFSAKQALRAGSRLRFSIDRDFDGNTGADGFEFDTSLTVPIPSGGVQPSLEASFSLRQLGLPPSPRFRFWVGAFAGPPGPEGDFLRSYRSRESSSLRFPRPVFEEGPVPRRAPAVDGISEDWRTVGNAWSDPIGDFQPGSRDLESFQAMSDSVSIWVHARFREPFGKTAHPVLRLLLDTDLDAKTGNRGYETEVAMTGAGTKSPCRAGCLMVKRYQPSGKAAGPATALPGSMKPDAAGHGDRFLEARIPMVRLGLTAGRQVRFYLESLDPARAGSADRLRGFTSIKESRLRTTFARDVSLDGLEDDWIHVRTAWADPRGDAGGGAADITRFALQEDGQALYVGLNSAGASMDAGAAARFRLLIDTDGNATTGQDGFERDLVLEGAGFGAGFLEAAIPWAKVGTKPGRAFRFCLFSESPSAKDTLQGFGSAAATRLRYPSELLQIGVSAHSGNLDTLKAVKAALAPDGRTYRAGDAFDVHLSVHGEFGTRLSDGLHLDSRDSLRFHTAGLTDTAARYAADLDMGYIPLISFHNLPPWFWGRHEDPRRGFGKCASPMNHAGRRMIPFFMPALPYCDGFGVWGLSFAREVTRRMEPYVGSSIRTVVIGNEVLFPAFRAEEKPEENAAAYDTAYTMAMWKKAKGGRPLPMPPTAEFHAFRSRLLMGTLQSWTQALYRASAGRLDVSSKLVPDAATNVDMPAHGAFPHVFDFLNDRDIRTTAVDVYPLEPEHFQLAYRSSKTLSALEFGGGNRNTPEDPDRYGITGFLTEAAANQNLRTATMYTWYEQKDGVPPESTYTLKEEQKAGLRMAMGVLASLPPPRPKDLFVKGILPLSYLPDGGWRLHADYSARLSGWKRVAEEVQWSEPRIAFEFDYREDGLRPDVLVRTLAADTALTERDVLDRKVVYLLYNPASAIRIGSRTLRVCGGAKGACVLAAGGYTLPRGAEVMEWTPQSNSGNTHLESDIPESGSSLTRKTLAAYPADSGKPAALRIGRSIFIAGDILWASGQGKPALAARFLSETIARMALDQF